LWNLATGERTYFVNGEMVGEGSVAPWASFKQQSSLKAIHFVIGASETALTEEQRTGICVDNICTRLYPTDASTAEVTIESVGSDGVVDFSQNKIKVILSDEIPGLTKDNFTVETVSPSASKTISAIEVASDGIVLEMESDLMAWTDYVLKLNPGDGVKSFTEGKVPSAVSMEAKFHTPTAPIDIKDPVFTIDGNTLTADTTVINTSGSTKVMTLVYAVYGKDGVLKSLKSETDENFNYGYPGEDVSFSTDFQDGDKIKFFIINGWSNPVPLFEKMWYVSDDGELMVPSDAQSTEVASDGEMVLSDFDYENLKITAHVNCGIQSAVDGTLYIHSKNSSLDDTTVVYTDYVTTSSDGTFKKDIYFKSDFNNESDTYIVEFYSGKLSDAISAEFTCLSEEDIIKNRKNDLFDTAKASTTFAGLMQTITGTNSKEEVVNDNFDVFCQDADTSDYEKVKSKTSVFVLMLKELSKADDYASLVELFEKSAKAQLTKEKTPSSSGGAYGGGSYGGGSSSGNRNYGATSGAMSIVPSKPEHSSGQTPDAGTSVVFSDLNGHWAEKSAKALVEKGIVNGYEDGTFRADSYITRAELTKIIVEALEIKASANISYTDVSSQSWYAPFVARAAASGVVKGFEDGSFAPEKFVSRQDAVLMIYRAMMHHATLPTGYKFFKDEKNIADYASDATRCLGDIGVINGTDDNSFLPLNNITRGEMAAVVCRAMDYMESHLK